jgi:uncharacterized protein YndB with AHSA1/START domain
VTAATEAPAGTTQVYRVYIKASPQRIWEAITEPEWTEKYGYGGRGVYDLRPGGKYTGYASEAMQSMGSPEVAVDGEVIESDPPTRLVMTWRMKMDETMIAEGFKRLTYEIFEIGDGVSRLTLTHELDGAPNLAMLLSGAWEQPGRGGAGGGWSWVLSDLKSLLETGARMAG